MSFFNVFKRKTSAKAVFLGLDGSGKSTFLSFLQEGKFVQHTPTMGKRKVEMDVNGTRISLFDMGGQADFRKLWFDELKTAKCVVFVIDESASYRFQEAREELDKILPMLRDNNINLLVVANKHDDPNAVDLSKIIENFNLFSLENVEILETSAKTGYGMANAFGKFYSLLTGEEIKKMTFARAISLFSPAGEPITTKIDETRFEQIALEGGFLAAITQFSQSKLEACAPGEIQFITFESEENGTFLVARTKNYIGSLLWQEDMGVTLDKSKEALKDLMFHVENACDPADTATVAFNVEQYITNLM
jgi:GTP-binding protein SAR1